MWNWRIFVLYINIIVAGKSWTVNSHSSNDSYFSKLKVSVDRVGTSTSFTRSFRKLRKPKETKLSRNGTEHVNNLTPEKIKKRSTAGPNGKLVGNHLATGCRVYSTLCATWRELESRLGASVLLFPRSTSFEIRLPMSCICLSEANYFRTFLQTLRDKMKMTFRESKAN